MKERSDTLNAEAGNLSGMDAEGFAASIEKLKSEISGPADMHDFRHLKRVEWTGRIFTVLGFATAWIIPNPLSAFCIQMGIATRFLLLHMISHGGYDSVPGIPARYTSTHFAFGWRRIVDCFEWWPANTWHRQHNQLHHYYTGESADPDILERHARFIRELRVPRVVKYILVFLFSITWKFTVYAPNAASVLDPKTGENIKPSQVVYLTLRNIFQFRNPHVRALWKLCYLPYGLFHFVAIPLLFLPLGRTAVLFVFLNRVLAELMTNFHGAMVILSNHTGSDLYNFKFHYKNKEEFYVTQVISSTNYSTGTEFVDYTSMWLNYQIEHHLFPRLPMLRYREIQPRVKALCERHGIPYCQERLWKRSMGTIAFMVGKTVQPDLLSFPSPPAGFASEAVSGGRDVSGVDRSLVRPDASGQEPWSLTAESRNLLPVAEPEPLR